MKRPRLLLVLCLLLGCSQYAAAAPPERIAAEYLPNAIRLDNKVISGGQPAGEHAFRELQALGVRTVISVDGAQPDVALARRFAMRYVHLPFGYDGIPTERVPQLAKAVRDLEGPIYIHCHHGKHRSPAAAAVACVAAGMISPQAATSLLTFAGTSPHYRGLYESTAEARPLDKDLLDALQVEFRETEKLPPLAEAMVAIEHLHDHLTQFDAGGWKPLAEHPDLDPAHEALLLREQFTELLRTNTEGDATAEPGFRTLLQESLAASERLETGLREWREAGAAPPPPAALQLELTQVSQRCKTCHEQFRDVPLSRKQRTDEK